MKLRQARKRRAVTLAGTRSGKAAAAESVSTSAAVPGRAALQARDRSARAAARVTSARVKQSASADSVRILTLRSTLPSGRERANRSEACGRV